MNRLLSALGIDYEQWKALTSATLKLDLRVGSRSAHGKQTSTTTTIVTRLVVYVVMGGFMAFVVVRADRFLAATIINSFVLYMAGMAMLLEHNAALLSSRDYEILGFLPITSRTYFAVRVTNMLIHALTIAAAIGLVPAVIVTSRHGLAFGLGSTISFFACALAVTLAMAAAYGSLLRAVGPRRLRSIASYLQFFASFAIFGGYFVFMSDFAGEVLESLTVPLLWQAIYPPAWFATYGEIVTGNVGTVHVLTSLASLVLLLALAAALRGRLSLEYAARLGELAVASTADNKRPAATEPGRALLFARGEARAAAMLVRAQFRSDMAFRMGVLGIIPITVIYLSMGLRDFSSGAAQTGELPNLTFVTMAALLFPLMLRTSVTRSDAYRASWIFFSSPADRARLILASNHVLIVFFLLPYLALLGTALILLGGNDLYIALHMAFTAALTNISLLVYTLIQPELPFSKPAKKGGAVGRVILIVAVVSALSSAMLFVLRSIYRSPVALTIAFAAIIAVTALGTRLLRSRVNGQTLRLEFEG